MAITIRSYESMVSDILARIVSANVGITDTSKTSVIRTIVESIVSEMDMQNYQISNTYDAMIIDKASGEDLDRLITILAVTRNIATKCKGVIRFGRTSPATDDIVIPGGSKVSTRIDTSGNTIEFVTTDAHILKQGDTYVDSDIEAVVAGFTSVGVNTLIRMNNPIMGIDFVTNPSAVTGGTDSESDESLRARAKLALAGLGKSTHDALESAVSSIDGVISVLILDQNRGPGTVDISVVSTQTPVPSELTARIEAVIAENKAAGIDALVIYPTIKYIDIVVQVTYDTYRFSLADVKAVVIEAINSYTSTLGVGQTFIQSQMERTVLNSSDGIYDIQTSSPPLNVTATTSEMVRPSSITINGEV